MKNRQSYGLAMVLLLLAVLPLLAVPSAQAQTIPAATRATLERGYRTGYSDGYQEGYGDYYDGQNADYRNKPEFLDATRAYETRFGVRETYRDGYQQGYINGYQQGYARRAFDPAIPVNLRPRVGGPDDGSNPGGGNTGGGNTGGGNTGGGNTGGGNTGGTTPIIPANTVLKVELLNALSTETNRRDDGFRMRVIEPQAYEGAIIEGHLARVKQPGRVKGVAEMQLTFDRIRLTNQRVSNFEAQIIEVVNLYDTNIRNVDPEGGLHGKDSQKKDGTIIGGTTAAGAVIGIAGGPVGVAVGSGVGAAVGAGIVLSTRGKQIRLLRNQQFKVVTSGTTRFVAAAPDAEQ